MNEKMQARLEKLKAKAKKYAPHAQAVVSLAATAAAAYYMREANRAKNRPGIDFVNPIDEALRPTVEISLNALADIENGATLMYRMFDIEPDRTVVQFTTREGGFPDEADELYSRRTTDNSEEDVNA